MPGFLSDGRTVLPGSLASERRVGEGGARVRRAVRLCLCVRNYGNSHRMRNDTRACTHARTRVWYPGIVAADGGDVWVYNESGAGTARAHL